MKRVLVTGINSYIGSSFSEWVSKYQNSYSVEFISLKDSLWRGKSFNGYDVILHSAAIVHKKENDLSMYTEVNKNLTVELAQLAKQQGVSQFIFISTMGVYGTETGFITSKTEPLPKTPYAQSKLEAEKLLMQLENENFRVTILRPPLVYGHGCKGNYVKLSKMIKKVPIFPKVSNQRSMIYIDNLSEFLRIVIDGNIRGLLFPQNKHFVNTTVLASLISKQNNKKVLITSIFNSVILIGLKFSGSLRKVFGSFQYDLTLPGGPDTVVDGVVFQYETMDFEKSIEITERGKKIE